MLEELTNFLQNAHWPQVPARQPTFFSIAGFPHYENVLSNVYQFFFDTDGPHNLGNLCIDALGDVLHKKRGAAPWPEYTFRRTRACRELRTNNGKRLDILLYNGSSEAEWQNAAAAVLIENKVYHWLANDLGEYWEFVTLKNPDCKKLGVVLGLKRETIPEKWKHNWVSITHLEWAQAVERRLGPLSYRAESRYVALLLELIENIRNMSNAHKNSKDLLHFFQQHYAQTQRIVELKQQLLDVLPTEIRRTLPDGHSMDNQSSDAKYDTWLTITSSLPQNGSPCKYLIAYGGLFKNSNQLQCAIHVINHDHDKCEHIRQLYKNVPLVGVQYGDRHYAVHKTYSLTTSQSENFAEHIATSLKQDWIILEHLWLDTSA